MISILIIDDDLMNCDLLTTVFTRHGYRVISATSGREGLELFRRQAPRVTLIDLRMPEMDGLTALKEIRAIDPHAPVIILGGGATEVQENQARTLRVTDFIRKGLSLDVLVEAVHRVSQLPVKQQAAPAVQEGGPAKTATGESILVADDEPLVLDLLVQFLSLRGYRVTGAKDGTEVLRLVEQSAPDLILLDLVMPGVAGVEVLQVLREKEYHGGVIVVTGSHNQEILEDAWALGPQEVVSKPIDLDRLLTAIQLVLVCREC
jgi:CheY-like chemotaxis protein